MAIDIAGKVVLVTGAGRGLGRGLAAEAVRRGARVVWAGMRNTKKGAPEGATALELDVTSEASVFAAAAAAQSSGSVDVLINNAATCVRGGLFVPGMDELAVEWETNVLGPLRVVRAFREALARGGVIANIASQLYDAPMPAIGNYCATKAALVAFSRCMRAELEPSGIRVVTLCPGAMDTDMSRPFSSKKQPLTEAAAEVLDALDSNDDVIPIGPFARVLWSRMANQPDQVRREKAALTYERVFAEEAAARAGR